MAADEHLRAFIEDGEESARLGPLLDSPAERHELYKLIGRHAPCPYRRLLLRLLDVEVAFRTAIWEGRAEADEEGAEGIFHCAYLISRCGEPADAKALWKAQYLNQDVGELHVGYFVGAGAAETLKFLADENDESSQEISGYIRDSLRHPKAIGWLESWQASRHAWLAG